MTRDTQPGREVEHFEVGEFEYAIEVTLVIPPIGGNRFGAKVGVVIRRHPGAPVERMWPWFPEWLGETRAEAVRKARAEIDTWIAAGAPQRGD